MMGNQFHLMMQILIPTDFTDNSHNAFLYGLHLAEKLNASITLLHVYPENPVVRDFELPHIVDLLHQKQVDQAFEAFERYGTEAIQEIQKDVPVSFLLEEGRASHIIASQSPHYQLIVMGTMGIDSEEEKDYGSETRQVIQEAQCPVLAIPYPVKYKEIKHIAYATSFDPEQIPHIGKLLEWVHKLDAMLSIVHIEEDENSGADYTYARIEQPFRIDGEVQTVGWYAMTHSDIITGLQTFSYEQNADWLAMTTHERDFIERWMNNSTTEEMSLYTIKPLLAFHQEK